MLEEIAAIMRDSDVSPFEIIHSGLVNKLLHYLTTPNTTKANRDLCIRRFLHVFLNCPVSANSCQLVSQIDNKVREEKQI